MALKFEDLTKPETLLVSAVFAVTWSYLLPAVGTLLRPIAKNAIKGGMYAADYVQSAVAEVRERAEDLTAEARAEHAERTSPPSPSAPPKRHEPKPETQKEPSAETP